MGELLLRDLHQRQPNSLPVLEMLALSAVRNEDYPDAVAALQALPWQWPAVQPLAGAFQRSRKRPNTVKSTRRGWPQML